MHALMNACVYGYYEQVPHERDQALLRSFIETIVSTRVCGKICPWLPAEPVDGCEV